MNKRIHHALSALLISAVAASFPAANAGFVSLGHNYSHVSIATQLTEVQKGTFDGRDYLTVHIGGHDVGPSTCRSNILRIDTSSESNLGDRQEKIEAIAFSAMLTSETVMIVVPLDTRRCVDGKPTFTDLYLLPASP